MRASARPILAPGTTPASPNSIETGEPFVSKLFRKGRSKRLVRTDRLKAMIVGAFVRGLSMREFGPGAGGTT